MRNERYDLGVWYTLRRQRSKYSLHTCSVILCTEPMWPISASRVSSSQSGSCFETITPFTSFCSTKSLLSISPALTATSASSGHGRNQSMVQQLISPGNLRARSANLVFIGEKPRTTWRLSRTVSMKYCLRLSAFSGSSGRSRTK